MISYEKGEIYLIDSVDLSIGNNEIRRPVIIVQNNIANKYARTLMVAPITSNVSNKKLLTNVEVDVLNKKSIILLGCIFTIDKNRLLHKLGKVSPIIIENINRALEISFDINTFREISKEEKEDYITNISKPLILTEGKTDVKIIETAWNKLYPKKEMFFECISSGIEFDKEKRVGSADNVRRYLEILAVTTDRVTIGIFDNDREGNNQFKGLSKKVFEEYSIDNEVRKHKDTNVWGMLLPVPEKRKIFVTDDDINQRYFVIEHYFSDEVLKRYNMYGKKVLDSSVFQVNNGKDRFSDAIKELDAKEFKNFKILFDRLEELVKKAN